MAEKVFDWERITQSETFKRLREDWKKLLADTTLKERDYHAFLANNPFFFLTYLESYVVISKLKLGSEYETDFVVVKEGYSDGTIYELIEIESPHTKLFDSKGKPAAKFNAALQQILDWKRFLKSEKSFFRKFLPTTNTKIIRDSKISFKIIIGRRTDNQEVLEKRRQYSEDYGVEILSFDRLTDISNRLHFSNKPSIYAAQFDNMKDYKVKNDLVNPFFTCTSDSDWKSICKSGEVKHFYYNNLSRILEKRRYSKYFDQFKQEIAGKKIIKKNGKNK